MGVLSPLRTKLHSFKTRHLLEAICVCRGTLIFSYFWPIPLNRRAHSPERYNRRDLGLVEVVGALIRQKGVTKWQELIMAISSSEFCFYNILSMVLTWWHSIWKSIFEKTTSPFIISNKSLLTEIGKFYCHMHLYTRIASCLPTLYIQNQENDCKPG